jgi:hypothetical protein
MAVQDYLPDSMAATARQVGANLIIDAGPVTSDRAAFAEGLIVLGDCVSSACHEECGKSCCVTRPAAAQFC